MGAINVKMMPQAKIPWSNQSRGSTIWACDPVCREKRNDYVTRVYNDQMKTTPAGVWRRIRSYKTKRKTEARLSVHRDARQDLRVRCAVFDETLIEMLLQLPPYSRILAARIFPELLSNRANHHTSPFSALLFHLFYSSKLTIQPAILARQIQKKGSRQLEVPRTFSESMD